jgi:hypothetical protein
MEFLTMKEKLDKAFSVLEKHFSCTYSVDCLDDLHLLMDIKNSPQFIYIFSDDFKECLDNDGNFIKDVVLDYQVKGEPSFIKTKKILDVFKKEGLNSGIDKTDWKNSLIIFADNRKGF